MSSRVRADFHKHLDGCVQCANHPFALCSEGARLLELAAQELRGHAVEIPEMDLTNAPPGSVSLTTGLRTKR